jgi:capsular polysaccharide transport system permease protein
MSRLFLWSVVLPTTFATVYFGFFAHDVYISESQFLVRSVQNSAATGLGSLLQSTGLSQDNDIYSVQNFILSRGALATLERKFQIAEIYGNHRVDLISRFNSFGFGGGFEYLLRDFRQRHERACARGPGPIRARGREPCRGPGEIRRGGAGEIPQ